jgi:hypothetical protein
MPPLEEFLMRPKAGARRFLAKLLVNTPDV